MSIFNTSLYNLITSWIPGLSCSSSSEETHSEESEVASSSSSAAPGAEFPAPQVETLDCSTAKPFLTDDLLQHHIFSYLSSKELIVCERVSKQFRSILNTISDSEEYYTQENELNAFIVRKKAARIALSMIPYVYHMVLNGCMIFAVSQHDPEWQMTAGVLVLNQQGQLAKLEVNGKDVIVSSNESVGSKKTVKFRLYTKHFNGCLRHDQLPFKPFRIKYETDVFNTPSSNFQSRISFAVANILNKKICDELPKLIEMKKIFMYTIAEHWNSDPKSED